LVLAKKETSLEYRVIQFIQKNSLFSAGKTLLVAVSGGADSVCLLHILAQRQTELGIKLHVAHLNHKLRGDESEEDAWYVADLTYKLDIPITMDTRDVAAYRDQKRCSLEEAAREVRYSFLAEVARSIDASCVAVGHTRDDRVETILMHLLRGTGIAGLRGLQPRSVLLMGRDKTPLAIVRPLLEISRQETMEYCRRFKLEPCSDSSNESPDFLRNRIRLDLLPSLKDYNPQVDAALLRLASIAADEVSYIEGQASGLWNEAATKESDVFYLDRNRMLSLPTTMQRQLFRMAVEKLLGNLKDIEADHIESMVGFLSKPAGKSLCLPHELRLSTEYGRLVLAVAETSSCPFPPLEGEVNLNFPGETILPGWQVKSDIIKRATDIETGRDGFTATFDLDKAGTRLVVRQRRRGDRFQPLGMSQFKKLQDFMVDARIPRVWRRKVPLICSPEQILWVVGWRIDDRAKVTESTKKVLRVKFMRTADDYRFRT
jgi:tRNA(Ile)-lysidine synthase